MSDSYQWKDIEEKWQRIWEEKKVYQIYPDHKMKKYYAIFAYPSPSSFLHIGQMRGFVLLDIFLRFKRMQNYNVFFPCGTHATGIPSQGFVRKLKNGNEWILKSLKEYNTDQETMEKLSAPEFAAYFLGESYKKSYKRFGMLVNTDAYIITISDEYKKFISWQFRTLNRLGYLVQKPHYAPFCPNCGPVAVDPSESDLSKGGNAEIMEYIMIYFRSDNGLIFPAATLRSETIFGVTNLLVNDHAEYVVMDVGKERWVVAKSSMEKYVNQFDAKYISGITADEIAGMTVKSPVTGKKIKIYKAPFVDPAIGTGVVMSVPSNAPYDYIASVSAGIKEPPVPIIRVEKNLAGDGMKIFATPFSAVNGVKLYNIKEQTDPKLEELTKQIYKIEYHHGVLTGNCGKYSGRKVMDAKDEIIKDLIDSRYAAKLYEFSEPVICRCGTEVIIKKIEGQWFINYSNSKIKYKTKKLISTMDTFPEEYRNELSTIIDWYDDRAATRMGNWLGTRFPLDTQWIIEPISDSTIYPAFYIIEPYIRNGYISVDDLTDDFFDAVFFGKNWNNDKKEIVEKIREDFEYWYPLDLNVGGKEHKRVHFPVFLMMHTMIFPEDLFPRNIFVNWWVTEKGGAKISKSKGGNLPFVLKAPEIYGADAMRMYYASVSPFMDMEWAEDEVLNMRTRLQKIYSFINENHIQINREGYIDRWFERAIIFNATDAYKYFSTFQFRDALQVIYYRFIEDMEWYLQRGGSNIELFERGKTMLIMLMLPVTPHLAEELWRRNHDTLLSNTILPVYEPIEYSEIEYGEAYIKKLYRDLYELIKILPEKPGYANIYTCGNWKRDIYRKIQQNIKNGMIPKISDYVSVYVDNKTAKKGARQISAMIDTARTGVPLIDEPSLLNDAIPMIERMLNIKVNRDMDLDPLDKKSDALPYRPAIYLYNK